MDISEESTSLIKDVAKNLQKWRHSNNISQRKLAQTTQVAESTIRSILNGTTNIEIATLVKFKLAFSVEYSELLYDKNITPTLISAPLPLPTIKKSIEDEQFKIGQNITEIMREKGLTPEELSILAFDTDYSDTLKYLKGKINLTLITILKFAYALNVDIRKILN